MSTLPHFKYNPDALLHGIIKKHNFTCPVCAETREYIYEGPFFAEEEVTGVCPWCIHDGSAAQEYNGEFIDAGLIDDLEDETRIDELTHRTPNYTGWQQEQWLSHCDDFCAFKGYVGWYEIEPLKEELADDLQQIEEDFEYSEADLKKNLIKDSGMQGYLFQCLHCGQHRLTVDIE